jgi:hypothetical protein
MKMRYINDKSDRTDLIGNQIYFTVTQLQAKLIKINLNLDRSIKKIY